MKTVRLGDVVEIASGATPQTSNPTFWNGTILWATPADLSELHGSEISATARTITQEGLDSCPARVLPAGSVLLSSRAPIGYVAIASAPMATNQGFKSLVPGPDVHNRYLFHWLRANTSYLRSLGNGATFKELSRQTVSRIEIPLPRIDEQRRIAAILDRADLLRGKRLNVLGHLERLTTSIFRQMFGDTGRPRKRLGSIAEWRSGGTPSRTQPELFGGPIPWFTSGELGKAYVSETRETLTELGLKVSSAKLIAPQNVLIGMYDTAALKTGITRVEASCNQAVAFSHSIQHPYSAEYIQAAIGIERDRILALRRGVRQKNLNLSMIRAIDIPAADEAEIVAFGRRMRSIHKTIASVREEQRLEDQLFASLQSRAFRGEL